MIKVKNTNPNNVYIVEQDSSILGIAAADVANHALADVGGANKLSAAFVKAVETDGEIFEPIGCVIWPDGKLVCAAGRTRLRAAQRVGLASIPYVVLDTTDGLDNASVRNIVQNFTRRQKETSEKAEAAFRLLAMGRSEAEAAARLGVSRAQVKNYARFVALANDDLKAIVDRKVKVEWAVGEGDDAVTRRAMVDGPSFTELRDARVADPTESDPGRTIALLDGTAEQQQIWVRSYMRRARARAMSGDKRKTPGRSFGAVAMKRFSESVMLLGECGNPDSTDENVLAIRDARTVMGASLDDSFAAGIMFAVDKATRDEVLDLNKPLPDGNVLSYLSETSRKAFVAMWEATEKRGKYK
jgi:hypothetical protein